MSMEQKPEDSGKPDPELLIKRLEAEMAMSRHRREAAAGKRNLYRALGVLMLLLFTVLIVFGLYFLSSRLPVDAGRAQGIPEGGAEVQ